MTATAHRLRSLIPPIILVLFLLSALGITVASGIFIERQINSVASRSEPEPPSSDLTLDAAAVRRVASRLRISTVSTATPTAQPSVSSTPPLTDTDTHTTTTVSP